MKRLFKGFIFLGLFISALILLFTYLIQPQKTIAATDESSPYGINIFKSVTESPNPPESYKRKIYEYLRDAGVKWTRDSHGRKDRSITSWARVEPEENQWQWEKIDEDLDLLDEYGFIYLGFLGKPPEWAQFNDPAYDSYSNNPDSEHPNNLNKFANYVAQLVTRYGCNGGTCQIKYWEVGNEPNNNEYYIDHPNSYVNLLETAYNTIKSIDPNAKVVLGGLGGKGLMENNFAETIFNSPHYAYNYFDVYNFHAYGKAIHGGGYNYTQYINKALNLQINYGFNNKPIWLTETSTPSGTSDSNWKTTPDGEQNQADDVPYRYQTAFDKGIDKVFWFRQLDVEYNPDNPNMWLTVGILYPNLNPKPAYYAYYQMTHGSSSNTPTKISGIVWIDTNGNGKFYWDKEDVYSCYGNHTKPKLALFQIGNPGTPIRTVELENGYFTFANLEAKKYHLRIVRFPVCNGVEYQKTKWQIKTSPSEGRVSNISDYDTNNGTSADPGDNWTNTPFWSIKVNKGEITNVYLGIQ